MREPDWLTKAIEKARAEGRILSDSKANKGAFVDQAPVDTGVWKPDLAIKTVPGGEFNIRVLVELPPPISALTVNAGQVGRTDTHRYRAWKREVVRVFKDMPKPAELPCQVNIIVIPGKHWQKKSDIANREKAITDAMVANGVLPDDSWQYVAGVRIGIAEKAATDLSYAMVWFSKHEFWWG